MNTLNSIFSHYKRVIIFLLIIIAVAVAMVSVQAHISEDDFKHFHDLDDKALLDKGYSFVMNNQPDSALVCYSTIANKYTVDGVDNERDASNLSTAFTNLANIYMVFYYDYKLAYEYLLKSENVINKFHLDKEKGYVYLSMASLLQTENLYIDNENNVGELLQKSFNAAIEVKDSVLASIAFTNLVFITIDGPKEKQPDISSVMKRIAPYLGAKVPDFEGKAFATHFYSAIAAYQKNDYVVMADEFAKAMEEGMTERDYLAAAQGKTSALLLSNKDKEVQEFLMEILKSAQSEGYKDFECNTYLELSNYYKRTGDKTNYQHYRYLYLEARDQLMNTSNLSKLKNVRFVNEIQDINEQMRDLAYKKRIATIIVCALSAVALVLLVLVIFIVRANRKLKENNRHLYESNLEMLRKEAEFSKLQQKKYSASKLDDDEKEEIHTSILHLMETSDEIYSTDFCIARMSELLKVPVQKLSQVINEKMEANFSQMVSEHRLREACRRLNDVEHYGNRTIESIAEELGFKSRTNFASLFKKFTGLTPSVYQKLAIEKQNEERLNLQKTTVSSY